MLKNHLLLVAAAAGVFALVGCVERTITITSEPSGALVHLNDEEIGRTPVTVPFRFYGVYDVRLTHEPVWTAEPEAAAMMDVSEQQVIEWVDENLLVGRVIDDERRVLMYYAPLWMQQKAEAPLWEFPGPDLIAEAVPGAASKLEWHFALEPRGPLDIEALIDRGQEMQTMTDQETVDTP